MPKRYQISEEQLRELEEARQENKNHGPPLQVVV